MRSVLIGRGARACSVSSAQCPSGVMVTRPRLYAAAPKSMRGSTAAARGSVLVRQLRRNVIAVSGCADVSASRAGWDRSVNDAVGSAASAASTTRATVAPTGSSVSGEIAA